MLLWMITVALGDAHRRQDRCRRIGTLDQVDLVDRDQLLVEAARHVRLGLVVEQNILDGPAEEAVAAVDLLDHDLRGDLVDDRGLREEPGQRERTANAHRLSRRRRPSDCRRRQHCRRTQQSSQDTATTP
jgi:hypothetical protein